MSYILKYFLYKTCSVRESSSCKLYFYFNYKHSDPTLLEHNTDSSVLGVISSKAVNFSHPLLLSEVFLKNQSRANTHARLASRQDTVVFRLIISPPVRWPSPSAKVRWLLTRMSPRRASSPSLIFSWDSFPGHGLCFLRYSDNKMSDRRGGDYFYNDVLFPTPVFVIFFSRG